MSRSLYIIAYDIRSNQARRKVADLLKPWRVGGQKSVAECWLNHSEFSQLWQDILHQIDEETDQVLVLKQDLRSHDIARGIAHIYAGQTFIVG